jgi:N-acetylneuraminic acid mutarotase
VVSFTARRISTSTAQEQKLQPVWANDSLPDATAKGYVAPTVAPAEATQSSIVPEGSVCGWATSTVYPVPILDQATVALGNNIYVFGGVSTAIIATANKFDGTTWTAIAPLPVALEFPTAVTDGTFIYILGGADTTGAPQTSLFRYDPVANTYTPLASFTTGTWNAAAVYLNGKIYKFAGTGPATNSTNALEIYDVAGNTWSPGAAYPLSSSFVGAFVRNGFVYGAGGITAPGSVVTAKTFRYDPVANSWDDAAIADLPEARWGAASSITGYGVNNGWVLAGGVVGTPIVATAVRWDPTANNWNTLPAMTGDRARFTGAILNGSFYAIGGRSTAVGGFTGTNINQKLTCINNTAVPAPGTVTITAEGCGTPNGAPDPGETLTVSLPITNNGDIPTTNLTATLQATGGVTSPSGPQNYGAIPPSGGTVTKTFTFTVNPALACGGTLTLTFTIADGATNYPNATKTYTTGVFAISASENFDGVVAPALPAGWTTAVTGTGVAPTTSTISSNSAPNNAFLPEQTTTGTNELVTPGIAISSASAQLSFKNLFNLENTFDGMVLEISNPAVNGGAFQDIIAAGGSFTSGGYRAGIVQSGTCEDPLNGRQAWTGLSGGTTAAPTYIDTVVALPASANGQTVKFKFLVGSDCSIAGTTTPGARIDDIQVFGNRVCSTCGGGTSKARADFDGDGKSDVSVFRPSQGVWYLLRSTAGFSAVSFGSNGDKIVPGDYDGDGKTDVAVFRGGTQWFILGSTSGFRGVAFGLAGDVPAQADYDGDGKTDIAVYRPSSSTFFGLRSSDGSFFGSAWGAAGDVPTTGDFDGDGKADFAVFRPSAGQWFINRSSGGTSSATWGTNGDKPVQADYDGDHKTDFAVFRAGVWYILTSQGAVISQSWGLASDKAVPADYDGDGKDDIAVFRDGTWYIVGSGPGLAPNAISIVSFGLAGDGPVPAGYVPEQ